ncbi:unnamed protein product [Echinostoma caproni]|uniref:Bravo_FIGEY domain-containing protein n=1 Tax=Echinostoma caproni TaxID=27848 RepID=A0A183AF72_9TREM|nr:unnamed protein product [Echinostoma caproni]
MRDGEQPSKDVTGHMIRTDKGSRGHYYQTFDNKQEETFSTESSDSEKLSEQTGKDADPELSSSDISTPPVIDFEEPAGLIAKDARRPNIPGH